MTERPILFTPGNVRAILDGMKTQTRRIVKPEPVRVSGGVPYRNPTASLHGAPGSAIYRCPYGQRGDRLWVREGLERSKNLIGVSYRSDGEPVGPIPTGGWYRWEWHRDTLSPIHMPKWAARLWLEIAEVRVQRLQEMEGQHPLDSDAIAEGVNRIHHGDGAYYYSAFRNEPHPKNWVDPTDAFKELWESINGDGSWEQNPWVWAITFKRVSV